MEFIKPTFTVNGHVASDKTGVIFTDKGHTIELPRKEWEEAMKTLRRDKKIETDTFILKFY